MRPPKIFIALFVLVLFAHLLVPTVSSAITAELAKKCRLMSIQAHPTRLPGTKNTGVEAAQRAYFSNCITNEGKMEATDSNQDKTPPTHSDKNTMPTDLSAPTTVPR
jgi:hypothetical protein